MDRELTNLRRDLTHVERGRGRRYPAAVRDRVARWTRARLAGGAGWEEIAAELAIAVETIKAWTTNVDAAEAALVPVEVVAELPRLGDGDHEFRLITRAGHRVEGLSLADVIEIARPRGGRSQLQCARSPPRRRRGRQLPRRVPAGARGPGDQRQLFLPAEIIIVTDPVAWSPAGVDGPHAAGPFRTCCWTEK